MSYGSYTSLDSLAANGIIDFDANSYLTGAPARYAGRLNSNNYLPFDQPILDYGSSYGMMPARGYQGGGIGPMNGYQGPWTSVRPSHARPTMHSQPHRDEFAREESHDAKSVNGWLTGITATIIGLWGATKLINKNYDKKVKKATAKAAKPKTKAELKAEAKATRKAEFEAFKNAEIAKGTSKVGRFFKTVGYRLKHAPKWLKVAGVVAMGAAGIVGLFANSVKARVAGQPGQPQEMPVAPQQHH